MAIILVRENGESVSALFWCRRWLQFVAARQKKTPFCSASFGESDERERDEAEQPF